MDINHIPYFYDVIGFLGAGLILLGFYRISIGRWTNRSLLYELDNILGPTLLIIYQVHHHAYISVILNVVWVAVAFWGVANFVERHYSTNKKRKIKP